MTHSSRIEWCVLAAIALAVAAFFLGLSYWIAGPVLLILSLCAYPQSYETTATGLEVRDALSRRLIPYTAIRRITPQRGRMVIEYGLASELVISPANGKAFLADIAERTPHLTQRGGELAPIDRYVEYHLGALGRYIPMQ